MQTIEEKYLQSGYVVIETGLSEDILDGARSDLAKYFGPEREHPIHVPMADYNRVQDAWHISQNVFAIATCSQVSSALDQLYPKKMQPFQTLNFHKGTQQEVHTDSIHFNSEPFGAMCGVWVALEDVGEDQGPLIYYPGSQKLDEMNYSDFDLPSSVSSYPEFLQELQNVIKDNDFQPEYGILKKGQALIWSANLLHGGSKQNNPELTRVSQVTHYYQQGARYWRPSESLRGRRYFTPDWVRDMSNEPYVYPISDPLPMRLLKASMSEKNRAKLRRILRRH